MKKSLRSLVIATLVLFSTSAMAAIDWSAYSFIGNGSGNTAYTDKYKITSRDGMSVVNIQQPGFATEAGIYMTFGAAVVSCTYDCAIQGAGIVLYVSQFTAQETVVTVTDASKSYEFTVYYADGTAGSDVVKPIMGAASLDSVTFNSAVINVAATDEGNSDPTKFAVYDTTNGIDSVVYNATSGKITVTGLTQNTAYSFQIYAVDASKNRSENYASVSATTEVNVNTACAGTLTSASDGSFTNGYTYSFATSGTDVTATIELLDTQTGLVAYLWNRTGGFAETPMTSVSGQKYTITLSGQTSGTALTLAFKFAYAGGMAVTSDLTYTVGDNCDTATALQYATSDVSFMVYPNPVTDELRVNNAQGNELRIYDIAGQLVVSTCQSVIDVRSLNRGTYIITDGVSAQKFVK